MYPVIANRIRTGDARGFNKGRSSKFCVDSQVWQTSEEGRRTYRPKRCGNNHKDEDNCPKTLNDKNHQTPSQKFRQLIKRRNIIFFLTERMALNNTIGRCPCCNGYRRRKWTRRHEFKSRTRLIALHIALIPLGKVWIQLFPIQLWVNSRTD